MQYAMRVLEQHPIKQTFFYIPQIVQGLRSDQLGMSLLVYRPETHDRRKRLKSRIDQVTSNDSSLKQHPSRNCSAIRSSGICERIVTRMIMPKLSVISLVVSDVSKLETLLDSRSILFHL